MPTEIPHFIGGKRVQGRGGRATPVFNPATGEETGRVALATAEEVGAGGRGRQGGLPGLGADHAAAPRAHPQPLPAPARGAAATRSPR